MDLEAKYAGHVAVVGLGGYQSRVDLKENVVEGGAKIGAIDQRMTGGFGIIDVFATCAVEFDGLDVGIIGLTHGQQRMRFAHNAWAFTELGLLVLVKLTRFSLILVVSKKRNVPSLRDPLWSRCTERVLIHINVLQTSLLSPSSRRRIPGRRHR